jgi:hypothetical protein
MRGNRIEKEADIYFSSRQVRTLSQLKLHILLLSTAEFAWSQAIK